VARTAVVAGTATAVSNRVSRRQAGRWQDQQQAQYEQQAYEQQQAAPYQQPVYVQAVPTPEPQPEVDMETRLARLKELASLKEMGVLSDAEFEAQKQQILNS